MDTPGNRIQVRISRERPKSRQQTLPRTGCFILLLNCIKTEANKVSRHLHDSESFDAAFPDDLPMAGYLP